MTTTLTQAGAAARAAASLLPATTPLAVGTATQQTDMVPLNGQALCAGFAGPAQGQLAIIVAPALTDALADAPDAPGADGPDGPDLAVALRPALEAAAATLGPVAVEPGEVRPALDALAMFVAVGGLLVPLTTNGATAAVVALVVTAQPTTSVPAAGTALDSIISPGLELLHDVELEVTAELGRTRMSVRELLTMAPGTMIELNSVAGDPTDLRVNGQLLARGEVVAVEENFGIRITEMLGVDLR